MEEEEEMGEDRRMEMEEKEEMELSLPEFCPVT